MNLPDIEAHNGLQPGRLWSISDMLKFLAEDFHTVATNLQEFQTITKYGNNKPTEIIPTSTRDHLNGLAERLGTHLQTLGAKTSFKATLRFRATIAGSTCTWAEMVKLQDYIDYTIADELSGKECLVLEPHEEALFNPASPLFGEDFAAKFKAHGLFELDEAAKCMALSRPTAAVFHLMRVLEIEIKALARCLQIPHPVKPAQRNWAIILKSISDGITTKWPTVADRACEDAELFAGLHASLDAVKHPWRNATMHVENKYTDEEAQHIFIAVRGFTKNLAARMDENGEPFA